MGQPRYVIIVKSLYSLSEPYAFLQQDTTTTITVNDRHVKLKDQLQDYQYRGDILSTINFYEFMLNTYEEACKDDSVAEMIDSVPRKSGRPKNVRISYLPQAEKTNKCRIVRKEGHEMVLRFIGRWFPRNNDPNGDNELHAACILLLFKPWRELTELKAERQSFSQSFAEFLTTATKIQTDMIENIQYYHDCWDVAQKRRDAFRQGKAFKLFDYEKQTMQTTEEDSSEDPTDGFQDPQIDMTTEMVDEIDIENARHNQRSDRDREFANKAMALAYAANAFGDPYKGRARRLVKLARRASPEDMNIIDGWESTLRELSRKQIENAGFTDLTQIHTFSRNLQPAIALDTDEENCTTEGVHSTAIGATSTENTVKRPKVNMLNVEQRLAHDIIEQRIFGGECRIH